MADIFLSYASRDISRVKSLVKVLEQQDWSVWWDYKIRIGKKFDQVIEEEISRAKCIVVLWSNASVQSDWVKSEAGEGKSREILAPAMIDDVVIPLEFRRIETARLHDWTGNFPHPEIDLLLTAIGEIIGQPPRPGGQQQLEGQSRRAKRLSVAFVKNRTRIAVAFTLMAFLTISGLVAFRYVFPPINTPLEKVDGDGQVIPAGGWKNFTVRVLNAHGQPIVGANVAWQTPECGVRIYVSETDRDGISSATNMCNVLPTGSHTQVAIIVKEDTPKGFTELDRIVTIGKPMVFTFHQQVVLAPI